MVRIKRPSRGLLSFLFPRSRKEAAVVAYLLREHATGRHVDDILQDPYVRNRLSPDQQRRILVREDVIRALAAQH